MRIEKLGVRGTCIKTLAISSHSSQMSILVKHHDVKDDHEWRQLPNNVITNCQCHLLLKGRAQQARNTH